MLKSINLNKPGKSGGNISGFEISKIKSFQTRIRDWMNRHRFPGKLMFFVLGIVSTAWFIVRVIPKPSRATYPCMRVAAPFMSGFILYLLAVGGITALFHRTRNGFHKIRFIASMFLLFTAFFGFASSSESAGLTSPAGEPVKMGPDDGPNRPVGKATGINPGRVVWVWDPGATNENCVNNYDMIKPENTDQKVVSRMMEDALKKLTGKNNLNKSWDDLFHAFNKRRHNEYRGYRKGEKIFIKINQGTANGKLRKDDIEKGFYVSPAITQSEDAKKGLVGTCETYPSVVLELLRQLVNVAGIDQRNISIGDPISHIFGHNYEVWAKEFPDVVYLDRASDKFGRTITKPTANDLLFYSDKKTRDKLYDVIENADYLINVANLKPHGRAGISLTAKNHFGSHGRQSAFHLHYSLISPVALGKPSNNGYRKYRVMVDIMGSKYLGRNTLLYIIDGLYGGGSNETRVPVKYFMSPFNNDWCNSIFISQDQVALESVCYDFLRTEWNGTFKHDRANNAFEDIPNVNGVDDYLHQAADPANWPEGIIYDPDNSGKPLASLGVHEHWNNPVQKQYSGNLGMPGGIELISVPDTLVRRSPGK